MREREQESRDRQSLCHFVIFIALAIVAGRIAVVRSAGGDTAFLSANDRSRWCTIASLVEHGTYHIDQQIKITNPIHRNRRPWDTIDKVQHTDREGNLHSYSSKPPLFPTMVAGVYAVLHAVSGVTMTEHPLAIPRIVLILVNLPLLWLFLTSLSSTIERLLKNEWAKNVSVLSISFGTMLLPFSISLNNHLPAAAATALVIRLYFKTSKTDEGGKLSSKKASKVAHQKAQPWWDYLLAGLAAAFAFANELPALSMLAFWIVLFFLKDKRSTLPMMAGVLIVASAFFGSNWIAHQSLRPPYAHRGNGKTVAVLKKTTATRVPDPRTSQAVLNEITEQIQTFSLERTLSPSNQNFELKASDITVSNEENRWRVQTDRGHFGLIDEGQQWRLTQWDDWYEYPGSYWQEGNRRGVDLGEPSRWVYGFHATLGHHGLFSLTPLWILVPLGFWGGIRENRKDLQFFSAATLLATLVCFAFYMARPMIDRNYGGVSVCFRWLLWLAPVWLVMVAGAMDRWAKEAWFRAFCLLLLASSVCSMSTALGSPWQSPWLYRCWQFWAG